MASHGIRPGTVQETLLIPLYGRAVEHGKPEPALRDARAVAMVAAIDYDFARFDGLPSLTGAVLRTLVFDHWIRDFLAAHPDGTVIEIGVGLNTRYERLDNGRARWIDLDLPDVIELRRSFFTDLPRRRMLSSSVTEETWTDEVASMAGGPYFFSAEAVLPFLDEADVRRVVRLLAERFPGALLALDTAGPAIVEAQDEHDALSKVAARMRWCCADPEVLTEWMPGARLLSTHALTGLPTELHGGLPAAYQDMLAGLAAQCLPQVEEYRLSLVQLP